MKNTAGTRSGIALLVVLAAILIVAAGCAGLARVASTLRSQRELDRRALMTDDLLGQAEAAAVAWLAEVSRSVALPVEAEVPELVVLRDEWTWKGERVGVTITGYDQNGLVSFDQARAGSPLRSTLPDDVLAQVDGLDADAPRPLGLDQFQSSDGLPSPFPAPGAPAFGAFVATHDVPPGRVNVNTAPMPVVETAMRMAGLGGIERIRAARAEGIPASVAAGSGGSGDRPSLVSASEAWAFRIDVRCGVLVRSWWCTFQFDSDWSCVQRLAIAS